MAEGWTLEDTPQTWQTMAYRLAAAKKKITLVGIPVWQSASIMIKWYNL